MLDDCAVDYGPFGAACNALLAAGEIETALRELDRAVLAACLIETEHRRAKLVVAAADGDRYFYSLGRLRFAQGALEQALETLLRCELWVQQTNTLNPAGHFPWRCEAAVVALGLGDRDRARELLADTLCRPRAFGAPLLLAIALRTTAMIDSAHRGSICSTRRSHSSKGSSAPTRPHADGEGIALRRAGSPRDAVEPLRCALDLASRCGGKALRDRARENSYRLARDRGANGSVASTR